MAESGWQLGNGESNGFKSITAFYPTEASNSNGIILSVYFFFSICVSDYFSLLICQLNWLQ